MRRHSLLGAAALWLGAAACNGILGIDEGIPRGASGAGGSGGEDGSGAASGSSGAAGGVEPKICEPGAKLPCYTGPAGTAGIGACGAGTRTCNESGTAYTDECSNEVVPWIEMCGDEDCDGTVDPQSAGCTALWYRRLSKSAHGAVAVDGAGNVSVSGGFKDLLECGAGPFVSDNEAAFSCAFDGDDAGIRWSKRLGAEGFAEANDVAVDSLGNWHLTGAFRGTIELGGPEHTSVSNEADSFVVKYGPNSAYLWSKRFGGIDMELGVSIAVDGAGNVLVTGICQGPVDFGGGAQVCEGPGDIFVVKLAPSGDYVWSKVFGATPFAVAHDIATDSAGNVVLTGGLDGSIDFGGGTLTSAGGHDIVVVKLNALGDHVWSQRFGDADVQAGQSIAVDSAGDLLVTGIFGGIADFGGGPLESVGDTDAFVAKLSATGLHVWSRQFGADDLDFGKAVAVDAADNVLLAGSFGANVDFGAGPLQSAGGSDIYVLKLTAAGDTVWSRTFGTEGMDYAHSIASAGDGNVVVAGDAAGLFVAKLSK